MADPTLPPLPPGFTLDQPSAPTLGGRPIIRKGAPPVSPTEQFHPITPQERQSLGLGANVSAVVSGTGKPEVVSGGGDKITYSPMSTVDKQAAGLSPDQPIYMGSNGLPTLPANLKNAAGPVDPDTARAHVSDILKQVDRAKSLLSNPLATGTAGSIFGHIPGTDAYSLRSLIGDPSDPNNPGQISGDLRQQGIAYLRALNGGNGVGTVARSQQEQAALQSAMSNLRQGLPEKDLSDALDNVKQIYLRAYARSFGHNPDDPAVQKQYGINPLYQLPGAAETAPVAPTKGADNGITQSNALPPLVGQAPEGVSTGDTKLVTNPQLAAIAPQLTTYLNADPKKITNSMILGFMKKNGVDPVSTNVMPLLEMRATGKYKGFTVDPRSNVPLQGVEKVRAEVSGSPEAATALAAGDTATLGTMPDVLGSLPGMTRTDVIKARDSLAAENPGATVAGNVLGSFLPLGGAGEASALARAGKTAASGGTYGFFGSDNPDIRARAFNGGLGALLAFLGHGVADAGGRAAQAGYRAATRPIDNAVLGSEGAADKSALNTAARKMPIQNRADVQVADAAARATGVPQPAAVSINRGGQDYLARAASGSPAARAVVDQVAQSTRQAIPQQLAGDFNAAIEAVAPRGVDATTYLNRPVRDIAGDIQSMAGREFERGIEPIKTSKLALTPELTGDLEHERVAGAIRDALANHNLSEETRNELRTLIPQLKTLATAPEIARDAYAKGINISVDSARNIATALNRTAGKLADGSEGQVEMSRLSRDIRGAIAEQYPEYAPVNDLYSSRMRAKEAMFEARRNFMASTPEGQDALAKAGKRFTDEPNPPEFGAEPTGGNGFRATPPKALPSNRQLAIAGAREAATVKAGEKGAQTADRIATNPNQRGNNATVLGSGADQVQARAAVRANTAKTVDQIASSGTGDQAAKLFNVVKQAIVAKATGGASHYQLAHAASSLGLSSQDAARVVRLYLDADAAPQVLSSLTKAYGARRARFIMARMAAVTTAASGVRGFPQQQEP